MDRFFEANAKGSPPAMPTGSTGYPGDGVPGSSPATVPGAWWFHMIGEEIRKVIVDGGVTPDHTVLTQLSTAIQALISSHSNLASTGHCVLGPILLNWGVAGSCTSGGTVSVTFDRAFSATPYVTIPVAPGYASQVGCTTQSSTAATLTQNSDGGGAIVMKYLTVGPA